eukprot:5287582-Pleurochrysis_carterae.AAC.1
MQKGLLPDSKRNLVRGSDVRHSRSLKRGSSIRRKQRTNTAWIAHARMYLVYRLCHIYTCSIYTFYAFCSQGGSENVDFSVHGLHATLVMRGIFDEIVWA